MIAGCINRLLIISIATVRFQRLNVKVETYVWQVKVPNQAMDVWKCASIALGGQFVTVTLMCIVLRLPADNLDFPLLVRHINTQP